jgi:hypothetical protein
MSKAQPLGSALTLLATDFQGTIDVDLPTAGNDSIALSAGWNSICTLNRARRSTRKSLGASL